MAPAAFCNECQLLDLVPAWLQTTTPPRPSLWPLRNLVVEWIDHVRAQSKRLLKVWRHECVVHNESQLCRRGISC